LRRVGLARRARLAQIAVDLLFAARPRLRHTVGRRWGASSRHATLGLLSDSREPWRPVLALSAANGNAGTSCLGEPSWRQASCNTSTGSLATASPSLAAA